MRRRKRTLPAWLERPLNAFASALAFAIVASVLSYLKGADDREQAVAPVLKELRAENRALDEALTFSLDYYR